MDPYDQPYFDVKIKPLLDHRNIEFIGEIGDHEKNEFLGNALALLFPISWHEPFGLVLIEALACGTPAVAYRRGSVPEIIEDGITGYIVEDVDSAVQALSRIASLNRQNCRQVFEARFAASRMAKEYISVYRRILDSSMMPTQKATAEA